MSSYDQPKDKFTLAFMGSDNEEKNSHIELT
jgi:hypothetical protein